MNLNHLPLARDTREAFSAFAGKTTNPGLIFDRYIAYWEDWTLEPNKRMDPPNPKLDTLKRIAGTPCDARLLAALSERQRQLFQSCNAKTFEAHPDWRFITGLGGHSPLEVGFTFHRLYGIPIIAGSSLKGLTRAYAEFALLPAQKTTKDEIEIIFGSQERAGAAVFFDALPTGIPQLELDVMNPHYPEWYQEGKPPANWQNPIPVFFLTVGKETWFRFAVGGRGKDGEAAKVKAHDWLKEALREMGAGAKTSAGYGYFSEAELLAPEPQRTEQFTVSSQTRDTSAKRQQPHSHGGTKQRTDAMPSPRPEDLKAAAEARKETERLLRQAQQQSAQQAALEQMPYRDRDTEEVKITAVAQDSFEITLKNLPDKKFAVKKKNLYRPYQVNRNIKVRILVNKQGEVTRVEEV